MTRRRCIDPPVTDTKCLPLRRRISFRVIENSDNFFSEIRSILLSFYSYIYFRETLPFRNIFGAVSLVC